MAHGDARRRELAARLLFSIALSAVFVLPATAGADGCVPGTQITCGCPGGASGIQVCEDDGRRFGACVECRPAAPAAAAPSAERSPPPEPAATETRRRSFPVMVTGIAALGTGVATTIAGGVLFAMKEATKASLDEKCGPDGRTCPPSAVEDFEAGRAQEDAAMVVLPIGISLLFAGAVMTAIGGTLVRVAPERAASVEPLVGPASAGVRLRF